MRRGECSARGGAGDSAADRTELKNFAAYVRRRKEYPKESERESYAAVYGEVIFDARPAPSRGAR